jgi:hypothetical protein
LTLSSILGCHLGLSRESYKRRLPHLLRKQNHVTEVFEEAAFLELSHGLKLYPSAFCHVLCTLSTNTFPESPYETPNSHLLTSWVLFPH